MSKSILKRIEEAKEQGRQSINLANGQITTDIWNRIIELENIESIFFDNIDFIDEILDSIIELKNLYKVHFHACNLEQILFSISKIKQLTSITFFNNNIIEFPESLTELSSLIDVHIGREPILKMPTFLFHLRKVKCLVLTELNIQVFSDLDKFKEIKELVLKFNNFSTLPKPLFELIQLEILDLSNNKLTELPLEFFTLHNLKTLNLDDNLITIIPSDIYKLTKLVGLDFKNNPIHTTDFIYGFCDEDSEQKSILDMFKLNSGNYTIRNQKEGFIFIQLQDTHAIIASQMQEAWDTLVLQVAIFIFGKKEEERKILLLALRKSIEQFIINAQVKDVYRYLLFPKAENFDEKIKINYNSLLKHKEAGEHFYFHKDRKFLVDNLLAYIGEEDIEIKEVWNGADKISKIQIKNFKLFQQLNFNVSERINIILGRNGLGKTSILQAITLGLLPRHNDDKSNELDSYIHFGKKNAEVSIFWGEEYRKAYIFSNELNEERRTPHPQKLLLSYGVNLDTEPKLDHSKIVQQIIEGNAKSYSTSSIFTNSSDNFYDPIVILEKMYIDNPQNKNKIIAAFVALIKDTINNYLSLIEEKERIYLQQDNLNFFFEDINKNQLKTRHLSEGYRDHILLMTDIIVKIIASRNNIFKEVPTPKKLFAEAKGVIIIDEFDRHLHPVWQRRLLWQLKRDFRNIQFILTTHNLFSLQSAEGFRALLLDVKDGTIQVEEKDIETGLSMKSIYNMFFDGKNKFFSYETEEDFKQFYELLRKVKLSTATPQEMKKFKTTIRRLLKKNEEVQVIIARELRQMERQTGKAFEL
ncbi:MAG: AAA family ATPase [Chitinophagales bacterium]